MVRRILKASWKPTCAVVVLAWMIFVAVQMGRISNRLTEVESTTETTDAFLYGGGISMPKPLKPIWEQHGLDGDIEEMQSSLAEVKDSVDDIKLKLNIP